MTPEICVALLTPFNAAGDIAFDALELHTRYLVDQGVTSLMPCGTTGEGPLLDVAEAAKVIAHVTRVVRGRVRVLAHVGRPSTRETVALAGYAAQVGATAVSVVTPYYYRVTDAQLINHYRTVLRSVPLPVYAYTIPERTGNPLPVSVVRELATFGLTGIKDSSKSIEQHREYLATGLAVLMGSDALVREAFRLGAAGAVSAVANVDPQALLQLSRSHDGPEGVAAQGRIDAVRSQTRGPSSTPFLLKQLVAGMLPAYPTHVRAPLS